MRNMPLFVIRSVLVYSRSNVLPCASPQLSSCAVCQCVQCVWFVVCVFCMCVCLVCVFYVYLSKIVGETKAQQSCASVIERSEQGGTWSAAFLSRASHSLVRSASLASTSLSCCLTFSKSSCPARNCICVTSSSLKCSFSLSFVSRSSSVCRQM